MGRVLTFADLKPKTQIVRPTTYEDSEILTDEMLLEAQRAYFEYRNKIVLGDALQVLFSMASNSIDCFIFSPPYWNVRVYGIKGETGLEVYFDCTPQILRKEREDYCGECYTCKIVAVAKEIYRVLKPTGVWYLNVGDTFFGQGFGQIDDPSQFKQGSNEGTMNKRSELRAIRQRSYKLKYYKEKSLCAIPERLLIGILDRAGFYYRGKPVAEIKTELEQDEEDGGYVFAQRDIWEKPNGFPSGIRDRYTLNYEMLYMFSKSKTYYFDREAIRIKLADSTIKRMQYTEYGFNSLEKGVSSRHTSHKAFKFDTPFGKFGGHKYPGKGGTTDVYSGDRYKPHDGRRNPGSIWRIATKTFPYEYCPNCDLLRGRKEIYHLCAECKRYVFPNRIKTRSKRPEQEMKSYTKRKAEFRNQEVDDECKVCKKVTAHLIMCNYCKQECFSHYAMFPEELVKPLIKAAVPKQCCPKCGTPRFPIYRPSEEYAKKLGKGFHVHGKDKQAGMMQPKQIETTNAEYELAGYRTPCWCDHNEKWVPGVVADIYCGYGTVLKVAQDEGVDYFGSDLDVRNVRASTRRLELAKHGKQLI